MASLTGKVAIVTGSSRGIGRAIAERLGRDGANVVVNYLNNKEKALEIVSKIETFGSQAMSGDKSLRAYAVQGDMSKLADIERLFKEALNHFGRIDIVVNNVGVGIFKPHAEITEEEFDSTFALNTKGAFFILQQAARTIADGGRIVNISVAGTAMPFALAGLNNGSRAATDQFTLSLSKELGARGITANNVALGLTRTEGLGESAPPMMEQVRQQIPLGRLGEPEDIADVVAFLCSHDSRWITSQTIRATGGLV